MMRRTLAHFEGLLSTLETVGVIVAAAALADVDSAHSGGRVSLADPR